MIKSDLIVVRQIIKKLRSNYPDIDFRFSRESRYFIYISLDSLSIMGNNDFSSYSRTLKSIYKNKLKKHIIFCYKNHGTEGFN